MKRSIAVLFLVAAVLTGVYGQSGQLVGTVTEAVSAQPIPNVLVHLRQSAEGPVLRHTWTSVSGAYKITDVSSGTYIISFTCLGYGKVSQEITVGDEGLRFDRSLEVEPVQMSEIESQTASRRTERVQDAPAGVTVLGAADIAQRPAVTLADHLHGVAGIDIVQKGIVQRDFVSRGLNNIFNGTMLTLTDYRIAGLPSLRANVSYLIPQTDEDIESIELVRGPSSAVYGPNVTNGVVNIITKSPFASRGTSISLTGGERSLFHGNFRHAGAANERFGYKISGQYLRANDWEFTDPGATSPRDRRVERFNGEARLDYLFDNAAANLTAGFSQAVRNTDITDNGPAQARDFRYYYVQGRFSTGDLFIQGYVNRNNAGDTYLLGTGQKVVDNSSKYVGEIQHGFRLGETQHFTYGANVYLTRPETNGTIFGANEGKDNIDEYGFYVQSETHLMRNTLRLILAGRADWHNLIEDPVFSPRAGLVFTPWEKHSFRLTYNRAYATPTTTDHFLDLLVTDDLFGFAPVGLGDFRYGLRGTGVPVSGYTFERIPGVGLTFATTFDRSQRIPVAGASALWDVVTNIVVQGTQDPMDRQLLQQLFSVVPQPTPQQVGGMMRALNLETRSFDPVSDVQPIPQLKPMINQTYEAGYKGVLGERLELGVDVFYSKVKDFITAQQVFTPNVFLNGEDVAQYLLPYLLGSGLPQPVAEAYAQRIAGGMAGIPLGTVSPMQAGDPTEILLAPMNAGNIDYWGIDLSTSLTLNQSWSLLGNYSFLNKNYFPKLGVFGDLALNAPKHKAALGVRYRHLSTGIRSEVRYRFVDGFRMKSAIYEGTINPYGLVDASVMVPLSFASGVTFTLAGTNLLDHKHQEIVGAPEIGRLVAGRLSWSF